MYLAQRFETSHGEEPAFIPTQWRADYDDTDSVAIGCI